MRLLLARGRAQRLRLNGADALGQDPKAAAAEDLAGVVLDPLEVGISLDEDVGDREGVVERQRRVVAPRADLLGPDLARDVHEHTAAVALAVDVAGAVKHLLEVLQGQRDRLSARGAVLAHRGVDRAGVAVLDRRRRDLGPPGKVRRKAAGSVHGVPPGAVGGRAVQLDLPVTAPSSSGRATGKRVRGL
jgi:hypothetical protein